MQTITVRELKQRLDANESIHLLDVREPWEFDEANMGGVLIPLGQVVNAQIDEIEHWKNEEVIVHCRSGKRSANACMILEQLGFTNTKNLEGGILAWQELNR